MVSKVFSKEKTSLLIFHSALVKFGFFNFQSEVMFSHFDAAFMQSIPIHFVHKQILLLLMLTLFLGLSTMW